MVLLCTQLQATPTLLRAWCTGCETKKRSRSPLLLRSCNVKRRLSSAGLLALLTDGNNGVTVTHTPLSRKLSRCKRISLACHAGHHHTTQNSLPHALTVSGGQRRLGMTKIHTYNGSPQNMKSITSADRK